MSRPDPSSEFASLSGRGEQAFRDGTVRLHGLAPVPVRVYGERRRGQVLPLVLHFHGGAFVAGDLENGRNFCGLLTRSGAIVVSIAYPLAPLHPFPQANDVGYGLLEWTHRQRAKLAGTGAPVFLAGEEAGGNLAASVAMIARDRAYPPLAGQILVSPMLDPCVGTPSVRQASGASTQSKWVEGWKKYFRCPRDSVHPYAVPGGAARLGGIAPTLVMTATDDPMRDEARAYADKLRAAGVEVSFAMMVPAMGWPERLMSHEPLDGSCTAVVCPHLQAFFAAHGPAPASAPIGAR